MHGMKLKSYMVQNRLTDQKMADAIGCSVSAVRKWRYGLRMPKPDQLVVISEATNGAVTANDFVEQHQEAAQ